MNNPDGSIWFGTYTVDLYEGPIVVEELEEADKNGIKLKLSIGKPGTTILPQPIRPTIANPSTLPKKLKKEDLEDDNEGYFPWRVAPSGLKTPRTASQNNRDEPDKMQQIPR